MRAFVDEHIAPFVHSWDEAGDYPPELHEKAYKAGLLATIWPEEFGGTPPKDFDVFHDLILVDELSRCGAGGILWAVFFSFGIALPPILNVGSQFLKDKVARDVITGKKIMVRVSPTNFFRRVFGLIVVEPKWIRPLFFEF